MQMSVQAFLNNLVQEAPNADSKQLVQLYTTYIEFSNSGLAFTQHVMQTLKTADLARTRC